MKYRIICIIISFISLLSLGITQDIGYNSYVQASSLPDSEIVNRPSLTDLDLKIEKVYSRELRFPSNMAFIGQDDILVLEKNEGTVRRNVNGFLLANPVLNVKVTPESERGMLGIAVLKANVIGDDNSERPNYIFLYYTQPNSDDEGEDDKTDASNRFSRYEFINDKMINLNS